MTRREYINELLGCKIDQALVKRIEMKYKTTLPDVVKRIISNANDTVFFDDGYRVLSFSEIENAEMDLHVNFMEKGIIPLFDCNENVFIVYHFIGDFWSKFNINDETIFKKKRTLNEILK